jgi:hypothetical protein
MSGRPEPRDQRCPVLSARRHTLGRAVGTGDRTCPVFRRESLGLDESGGERDTGTAVPLTGDDGVTRGTRPAWVSISRMDTHSPLPPTTGRRRYPLPAGDGTEPVATRRSGASASSTTKPHPPEVDIRAQLCVVS